MDSLPSSHRSRDPVAAAAPRAALRLGAVLLVAASPLAALAAQQDVGSSQAELQGRDYYVDPAGDDAHDGLTLESAWRTLAHSLPLLEPGDSLNLRGGTYYESELTLEQSGAPGAPITIRAWAGEHPVIDGSYAEFREAGNEAWELVDPALQIFRSVQQFPGAGVVYGHLGADDGSWALVPYELQGAFATTNETYSDTPPYYYIGPGVFWDATDGRIYYRSQHGVHQLADGLAIPSDPDPRNTPLFLFPKGNLLEIDDDAGHIVLEGLELRNRATALHLRAGAHHVTVRDCQARGGRYHILVRDGAHDLTFDGVSVAGGVPGWVAWTDVKWPDFARPGHLLQGSAIHLSDVVDRVEIVNCSLSGVFDAIGATGAPTNLAVHHNLFDVRDDVLHLGSAGWNVEFHHNQVVGAHAAGPSWSGSGSPPPGRAGTVWIHHNVLDASAPQRFGRADPQGLLDPDFQGPAGDGFAHGRAFGMHSKSEITGPSPWKIYHNTIIVADDVHNGGAGQAYRVEWFDPAVPHEVFNNIFVQVADAWLLRDARTADGSQVFDGNLYWAPHRVAGTDLLEDLFDGTVEHDFVSLAQFVGSSAWAATRSYYAPGWETSGVEGDPQLDEAFVPRAGGLAAGGAVDLSGKDWPGLAGETFRGALAPAGSP